MRGGNRLQALQSLLRLPLLPTAVADSLAGYLIALPAGTAPSWRVLSCLAAASGCLYMGGMALNDAADLERDRVLHPGRPLPSGALGRASAVGVSAVLSAGGVAAAFLAGTGAGKAAVMILAAVCAYDLLLKPWRIPGSLAMGACRALNLALGLLAGLPAMRLGAPPGALAGFGVAALLAAPAALGAYVAMVTLLSTMEEAHPAVSRGVAVLLRGIIPLDAALVAAYGRPVAALAVLALLPLSLGLGRLLPRHE